MNMFKTKGNTESLREKMKSQKNKTEYIRKKINEKYNNQNKNSMDGLNNRMKETEGNNH